MRVVIGEMLGTRGANAEGKAATTPRIGPVGLRGAVKSTLGQRLGVSLWKRVIAQSDLRPMDSSKEAMEDLKGILAGRAAFYSKTEFRPDTSVAPLEASFRSLRTQVRRALSLPLQTSNMQENA